MKRPKAFSVGRVHVRVARGPRQVDGRWYWRAERRVEGARLPVWMGWGTMAEAEREVARAVAGGPVSERQADGVWTVFDLVDFWLGAVKGSGLSPNTISHYEYATQAVSDVIGGVRVDRIDIETLERYRDRRLREAASGTVAAELRVLRVAWAWARERGRIPDRTLPRCRCKVTPVRSRYTPTRAEVLAVIGVLRRPRHANGRHRAPWHWRAVWLYWSTGCRRGELDDLRVGGIRLERCELAVVGKTGPRVVRVHPRVMAEIASWGLPADPTARVWGIAPTSMRQALRIALADACVEAGVPVWSVQALRRHATDALFEAGADPGMESSQIGHSPAVAVQRYRHARAKAVDAVLDRAGLGVLARGEVVEFRAVGSQVRVTAEDEDP
jgi:integrase